MIFITRKSIIVPPSSSSPFTSLTSSLSKPTRLGGGGLFSRQRRRLNNYNQRRLHKICLCNSNNNRYDSYSYSYSFYKQDDHKLKLFSLPSLSPSSSLIPSLNYKCRSFGSKSEKTARTIIHSTSTSASTSTRRETCESIKVWEVPFGTGMRYTNTHGDTHGDDYNHSGNDPTDHKMKDATLYTYSHTTPQQSNTNNKNDNIKNDNSAEEILEWKVEKPQSKTKTISNNTTNNNNDYKHYLPNKIINKYMLTHFLPSNYTQSVDKGYITFASYCFLSSICGSAAMVLSTQTLLLAVGVGNASAAPMAGALNWVMKDGIGQLGGVLFASKISSSNDTGNTIDTDPKRWRVVSALSMDGATLLEIMSPLFPTYFLFIASIANIGKNIGFLTASASRAALHQSLALKDNLGDVTAKAGSQSIAASLIGTCLGIGLSSSFLTGIGGAGAGGADDYMYITFGFVCLSSMHQYCTYKSLKAVALKKLNRHRLNICLDLFFQNMIHEHDVINIPSASTGKGTGIGAGNDSLLSPENVAKYEKFIPFIYPDETHKWLMIGCPLIDIVPRPEQLQHLVSKCLGGNNKEKYVLNCTIKTRIDNNNNNSSTNDYDYDYESIELDKVLLTFHHDATDIDMLRGIFHAHTIHNIFTSTLSSSSNLDDNLDDDDNNRNNMYYDLYNHKKELHTKHNMMSNTTNNNNINKSNNNNDDATSTSTTGMHIVASSYELMNQYFDPFFIQEMINCWDINSNSKVDGGDSTIQVETSSSVRLRIRL